MSSQSRPDHFKPDHTYTSIYNIVGNSTVQLILDLVDKSQKSIRRHYVYPSTNMFAFDLKSRGFRFNLIIFIRKLIKIHYFYMRSFLVWSRIVYTLYILVFLRTYLSKDIPFNEHLPASEKY